MRTTRLTRRDFVKAGTMGSVATIFAKTRCASAESAFLNIEQPFHGAILNRRHGSEIDGVLMQLSI